MVPSCLAYDSFVCAPSSFETADAVDDCCSSNTSTDADAVVDAAAVDDVNANAAVDVGVDEYATVDV